MANYIALTVQDNRDSTRMGALNDYQSQKKYSDTGATLNTSSSMPTSEYFNGYYEGQPGASWDGKQAQNSFDWGGAVGAAAGGISAGMKYTAPKGQFEMDRWAGLKGGVEGSVSGLTSAGPIGAVVGGIGGTLTANIGQSNAIEKAIKDVSTDVKGYTTIDGRPTYLGGNIAGANQAYAGLETAAKGDDWNIASVLDPLSGLVAYNTANKAEKKQKELSKSIAKAQTGYNEAVQSYNRRRRAQYEYERMSDPSRRLQNLY